MSGNKAAKGGNNHVMQKGVLKRGWLYGVGICTSEIEGKTVGLTVKHGERGRLIRDRQKETV